MVTVREKTTVTQRIHGNCPNHGGCIDRLHQRHQPQMREETRRRAQSHDD